MQYSSRFGEWQMHFYDSQYESWSKYITGTSGVKPSYDVLGFLIEEAHKRNIQFHAWLNPYRISTRANKNSSFPQLDPKIPSELTKDYEKIRIYNPAFTRGANPYHTNRQGNYY